MLNHAVRTSPTMAEINLLHFLGNNITVEKAAHPCCFGPSVDKSSSIDSMQLAPRPTPWICGFTPLYVDIISFLGGVSPHNVLQQDVAVRFLQVRVVVLQLLRDFVPAGLVELHADLVEDVHVQVDALGVGPLGEIFLEGGHHLAADAVLAVGFEDSEGEDVGVFLVPVVFEADGVGADDDVVVVGVLGEVGVLGGDLDVESRRVLDGEGLEVEFPQQVDVLVVDVADRDRQRLLLPLSHHYYQHPTHEPQICSRRQGACQAATHGGTRAALRDQVEGLGRRGFFVCGVVSAGEAVAGDVRMETAALH